MKFPVSTVFFAEKFSHGAVSGAREVAQIALRGPNVTSNLLTKGFGRGPLALITQTGKKCNPQGSRLVERDGLKIKQVAFDGEGCILKGWTGANV